MESTDCRLRIGFLYAMTMVLAMASPAAGRPAATPAPDLVRRVSAEYVSEMRGLVGMQRHFITDIHAGPVHHTEQSDSAVLMTNGAFVQIKYYRVAEDGRPWSAAKIGDRDTETNRDWKAGKVFFKEPYDPRFTADYAFEQLPSCMGCAAGTVAVKFTSLVRDAQHGDGTMWIDPAAAHVLRLTYAPAALPPHATSGTVTEIGGEALHDLWYVVHIDESYEGTAFYFRGSGTFTATFDHFRRFSQLADATAALLDGTI